MSLYRRCIVCYIFLLMQCSVWAQEQNLTQDKGTVSVQSTDINTISIQAETLTGNDLDKREIELKGNVGVQKNDAFIKADRAVVEDTTINLEGNVWIKRKDVMIMRSKAGRVNIENETGRFDDAAFFLYGQYINGTAESLNIKKRDFFNGLRLTMTSCVDENPDWEIEVAEADFDLAENYVDAYWARIRWLGITVFATPYLGLPLSDRRHSGWLQPQVIYKSGEGANIALPYYFNLAPEFDLTLTPRLLGKRGLMLGAEFRYLFEQSQGVLNTEWVPRDKATGSSRSIVDWTQSGTTFGSMQYSWAIKQVSDNDWWKDYREVNPAFVERMLESRLSLSRYFESGWGMQLRFQKFTLQQSEDDPLATPYQLWPGLSVHKTWNLSERWSFDMPITFSNFRHPTEIQGNRAVLVPKLRWNWRNAAFSSEFAVDAHTTKYWLSDQSVHTRVVPQARFSLSAELERDAAIGEYWKGYTQTLESRLIYQVASYRDQSMLPVFDSAVMTLNPDNLDQTNLFSGNDRISDSRHFILGIKSRLLDTNSREVAGLALAQRFGLNTPKVTLPNQTLEDTNSDLYASAYTRLGSAIYANIDLQYSVKQNNTLNRNWRIYYHPSLLRSLSLQGTDNEINQERQTKFAWKWPMLERVHSLGYIAYDFTANKINGMLLGFEWVSGCWLIRLGFDRISVSAKENRTNFLFEIQLGGLSGIGTGASKHFRKSIPNYTATSPMTGIPQWVNQF